MRIRFFIFLVLFAFAFAQSPLFAQNTQNTQNPCNPPCPNPCKPPCPSPTPAPSTGGGTSFEISPYAGYIWNGLNNGVGSFMNTQILGVRGGGYVTSAFEIGGNWSWNNHFQPKPEDTTAAFAGFLGFPQASVRSNLWELEFTYHFGSRGLFGHAVRPYLVAGAGGITTTMKNGNAFVLNNTFIDVPGVSTDTLAAAHANGTLQNIVPGVNTTNGVAFVPNANGNGSLIFFPRWPNEIPLPTNPSTPTTGTGPTGAGSTVVVARDVFRDNSTFFTFSYGGGLKVQRLWGPLGFFADIRGRTIPNLFNGHGNTWLEVSAGPNFAWGEK